MAESTERQEQIYMIMRQSINKLLKDLSLLQPSGTPVRVLGSFTVPLDSNNEMKLTFNQTFAVVKNSESITGLMNTTVGPKQKQPTKNKPKPTCIIKPKPNKRPKPKIKPEGGLKGKTPSEKKDNAVRPTKSPTPASRDVKQPDEPRLPDTKKENLETIDPVYPGAAVDNPGRQDTNSAPTITKRPEATSNDLETELAPSKDGTTKRKADSSFEDNGPATKHLISLVSRREQEKNQKLCYYCPESFAQQETLNNHIKKCHIFN